MAAHHTYYLVDLFCILFPFLFSFHPKLRFYTRWRSFFISCVMVAAGFIAWDVLYTWLGVWSFNPGYTGAGRFINLPFEEVLFFFCIPYACIFTYHCLNLFYKNEWSWRRVSFFSWGLVVTLLLLAFFNASKIYTSGTCFLLAVLILVLLLRKVNFLFRFYRLYALILIPFMISNGILTGTFIDAPVVMYNDAYNLGIRLLTIPVEDVFYGMLLVLLNVSLFERLEAAKHKTPGAV